MPVVATIYCIWSQYMEWRERRNDWQCSMTALKESRNFQTHISTLKKAAPGLVTLLLCQKGERWRWANSRPAWLFSKLKINTCNSSNKHRSPRSEVHSWHEPPTKDDSSAGTDQVTQTRSAWYCWDLITTVAFCSVSPFHRNPASITLNMSTLHVHGLCVICPARVHRSILAPVASGEPGEHLDLPLLAAGSVPFLSLTG